MSVGLSFDARLENAADIVARPVLGPESHAPARSVGRPWLMGPLPDLIFGCGLGYAALVLALFVVRPDMARLSPWLPFVILVTGIPHYGATLLRVYASREARRLYAGAAFGSTALIWGAFVLASYWPLLGALLITLYLSWSPWHYAGQNYGLAMMFLGRRRLALPLPLRRLLRASFVFSFALILLNLHRASTQGAVDPSFAAGPQYGFLAFGFPEALVKVAFPTLAAAYLGCLVALAIGLRRVAGANLRALLPCICLVATQALWFAIPAAVAHVAPNLLPLAGAPVAFIWIAVAHSVQYLWVTLAFAQNSGEAAPGSRGRLGYLQKTLLAGAAIWVVPALIFAPGALGRVPFDAGLGLLVAAAVNLHHFVLDQNIWRLREPRIRRVLVAAGPAAPIPRAARPRWSTLVFSVVGTLCAGIWMVTAWEQEFGHRRAAATGDIERVRRAADRLSWLGRDDAQVRVTLGKLEARRGNSAAALDQYQRSLALGPTASAWAGIGGIRAARGDLAGAEAAFEKAVNLAPARLSLHRRLGEISAARETSRPGSGQARSRCAGGLCPRAPPAGD